MTTIEPGVVERLVERLLRKCDGTNDSDAATMAEAATLLAQQQARIGEMEGVKRQCSICTAIVASYPEGMCCHCRELPWPIVEKEPT